MRSWFRHLHFKLREQLLFGAMLMVIIPVLAVGFWVNHRVSVNLHQEALQETAQVADNLSLTLEHLLEMHKANLLAAAGLGDWGDPEGQKTNLEAIYRSEDRWSQVAYWEAGTGRRLATQPFGVTTLATARSQPWFEQSLGRYRSTVCRGKRDRGRYALCGGGSRPAGSEPRRTLCRVL